MLSTVWRAVDIVHILVGHFYNEQEPLASLQEVQ